jgi:hypothetical protein
MHARGEAGLCRGWRLYSFCAVIRGRVCVRVCVRARARACVCACVWLRVRVRVRVHVRACPFFSVGLYLSVSVSVSVFGVGVRAVLLRLHRVACVSVCFLCIGVRWLSGVSVVVHVRLCLCVILCVCAWVYVCEPLLCVRARARSSGSLSPLVLVSSRGRDYLGARRFCFLCLNINRYIYSSTFSAMVPAGRPPCTPNSQRASELIQERLKIL